MKTNKPLIKLIESSVYNSAMVYHAISTNNRPASTIEIQEIVRLMGGSKGKNTGKNTASTHFLHQGGVVLVDKVDKAKFKLKDNIYNSCSNDIKKLENTKHISKILNVIDKCKQEQEEEKININAFSDELIRFGNVLKSFGFIK